MTNLAYGTIAATVAAGVVAYKQRQKRKEATLELVTCDINDWKTTLMFTDGFGKARAATLEKGTWTDPKDNAYPGYMSAALNKLRVEALNKAKARAVRIAPKS